MVKINWKEQTKDNILAYTVSGVLIAIVCYLLKNWSSTSSFLARIGSALAPFVFGFCIAFILIPLRQLIENKWLRKTTWKPRTKRNVAVAVSMVVLVLVIASFFAVLIPQLSSSVKTLATSMDGYMSSAGALLENLTGNNPGFASFLQNMYETVKSTVTSWFVGRTDVLSAVLNYSMSVVQGIFNFFVGLIIAIYILLDQEKFKRQIKKFMYATMKKEHAEYWFGIGRLTSHMFNRFIFGKALDSLIIGIACWICISIMQIPYAPLISFVVGLTNMIPVFGPFIGAIPCIFILLIIQPLSALEFAVFILVLQQIDGNILGPYILGDSMGLPTLWVMFAIIAGGSLFGVIGMFIGVPVFSVIYVMVRDRINRKLKEKQIQVE